MSETIDWIKDTANLSEKCFYICSECKEIIQGYEKKLIHWALKHRPVDDEENDL